MEPISRPDVVHEESFIHQVKWDGIRGVVHISGGAVEIYTKKGYRCTWSYPEMQQLPGQIDAQQAILDGEMVVLKDGKPSFKHLLGRNSTKNQAKIAQAAARYPVTYIIFDILMIDGGDLTHKALHERQSTLNAYANTSSLSIVCDNFEDGDALFTLMKQNNMEGIVSKRLSSMYTPGKKHNNWYKTKIAKKMLCVVTGAKKKNGMLSSIILSIFEDNQFVRIGSIYSGLKQSDLKLLSEFMQDSKIKETDETILVEPKLTCWVRYSDRNELSLRNPVLLGFSDEAAENATGAEVVL